MADDRSKGTVFEETQSREVPEFNMPASGQLEQGLREDVAASQAAFKQAQTERGVVSAPQERDFRAKGIRIGKRVIAQNEFSKATSAQDKAIQSFVTSAGLSDEVEIGELQNQMNVKLNGFKKKLIQQGLKFQAALNERQASAEQKRAAQKLFGQLAGMGIGAALGGAGGAQAGGQVGGAIS